MIETVAIAGVSGWTNFSYNASKDAAAPSFSVETTNNATLDLTLDTPIEVTSNGDLLLTGFIEQINDTVDVDSGTVTTISGRSATADIVDGDVEGSFQGLNLLQIIEEVARPFGITVTADDLDWPTFENYTLNTGVKAIGAIHDALQVMPGAAATSTREGGIRIRSANQRNRQGSISTSTGCLAASATLDGTKRISQTTAYSQAGVEFDNSQASSVNGTTNDNTFERHRPRIIFPTGPNTTGQDINAARRFMERQFERSVTVNFTVSSWRDESGAFWEPGSIMWVDFEPRGISQDMLLDSVTLLQSVEQGTTAELTFVPITVPTPTATATGANTPVTEAAAPQPTVNPQAAKPIENIFIDGFL